MSAPSRYSGKQGAPSSVPSTGPSAASGAGGSGHGGKGTSGKARGSAATPVRIEALKNNIFDFGEPGHTELYRRTRDAVLDYIRVNLKEGDAVAESILGEAVQ